MTNERKKHGFIHSPSCGHATYCLNFMILSVTHTKWRNYFLQNFPAVWYTYFPDSTITKIVTLGISFAAYVWV